MKKRQEVVRLLPEVSIIPLPKKPNEGKKNFTRFEILHNKKTIGNVNITKDLVNSCLKINHIELDKFRNGDHGKVAYLEIIKKAKQDNLKLSSKWHFITKGADSNWQWLVKNNYAKITHKGERDEKIKGAGYSSYQYESL